MTSAAIGVRPFNEVWGRQGEHRGREQDPDCEPGDLRERREVEPEPRIQERRQDRRDRNEQRDPQRRSPETKTKPRKSTRGLSRGTTAQRGKTLTIDKETAVRYTGGSEYIYL